MAYNYFPVGYQPYQFQNQFQNQYFQNQYQNQNQIQNGGYVPVRSEEEARYCPVQLGHTVTFMDETKPYCYKKTMGLSPLDRPVFEKYRIVKEETSEAPQAAENGSEINSQPTLPTNDNNAEIGQIQAEIKALKEKITEMEKWHEHSADLSANESKSDAVFSGDGNHAGHGDRPE